MNWPSFLLNVFRCLITTAGITFLRSSGFPFLTVASTMSPLQAAGSLDTTWIITRSIEFSFMYSNFKYEVLSYNIICILNVYIHIPVESAPDPVHGDHVEVLASGVVGAVHDGAHWTRQRHPELGTSCSSTSWRKNSVKCIYRKNCLIHCY